MASTTDVEIAPGAHHFSGFLSLGRQVALVGDCRALVDGAVPAYVPVVRGGGKMHVRMLCLGRHWNGQTYRYESTRSDFDGLPAPEAWDERHYGRNQLLIWVKELPSSPKDTTQP